MESIIGVGLRGIRNGFEQVAKASERLTQAFRPDSSVDPVAEVVAQSQGSLQAQASTKVVKVADKLTQSTLDIIA
jgi:hypothetical protein